MMKENEDSVHGTARSLLRSAHQWTRVLCSPLRSETEQSRAQRQAPRSVLRTHATVEGHGRTPRVTRLWKQWRLQTIRLRSGSKSLFRTL